MKEKITTIEDLAVMVARGFGDIEKRMATKEDLKELATKDAVRALEQKMDAGFQNVYARLDTISDDISDLPAIRQELRDIDRRVERLERRERVRK